MINTDMVYNCIKIITDENDNILKYIIRNTSTNEIFEFDQSMIDIWKEKGIKIVMFDTVSDLTMSIRDKNLVLAKRLKDLSDYVRETDDIDLLDYASIRASVIAGANSGFQESKETYMSNQGVYKHFDGCTTVIDVDGFYHSDMGGYQNVADALQGLSDDIQAFANGDKEPVHGINDKEFNLDKLLDVSSTELLNLLHERIVTVSINCSSDKQGTNRKMNKVLYLKPVYKYNDLITDLKVIYRVAKEMAIECTK